ncbi:DUF2851 family protein [Marinilabilia rubra]|uniref:DUF2851 domain-containing protein n=1 Tax=Marinilabilia rubra TaxID=2162893 RepID=A0A2U2B881_9BACT|nr:DUF2851 family protein [Marinilabilia rubra]PWD99265.1 DUF2851 domain-containing protein [Marinilabilia rubra]
MNEEFLHFLWQHKFYKQGLFYTSCGQKMEVIHPGLINTNSGPDFFNAKIKLDGVLWAGNVEIHYKASDWYRHNHYKDSLYDNVILHVVVSDDEDVFTGKGRRIPAWEMEVPERTYQDYDNLLRNRGWIPCQGMIDGVSGFELAGWVERMLIEKLEKKVEGIETILHASKNDWQEVLFIVLSRNFGFGLNGDPFERLARQTPWKIVARNSDAPEKLEALFLGQAGFLNQGRTDDRYMSLLQREYNLIKHKYGLEPIPAHNWKFLRLRPGNFPTIRLVQLAALIARSPFLFDHLLRCNNLSDVRSLFYSEPQPYWINHYRPFASAPEKSKKLGKQAVDLIIINTVVPLFFSYGRLRGQEYFKNKAIDWLNQLPAEKNQIVNGWKKPGIELDISSAAESQGLVYLKKMYCDQRKCLSCRVGHRVVSQNTTRI